MAEFDDEIVLLKGAAISALTTFLHDSIRTYIPTMAQHLDQASQATGRTLSTATNISYDTGYGGGLRLAADLAGPEQPTLESRAGGSAPYYQPGSSEGERYDTTTTHHPTSEHDHKRAVGTESGYWREA